MSSSGGKHVYPLCFLALNSFTLNASLLIRLERCQQWFLKNILYVPVFAPSSLLLKLSGLYSIEAEIDLKRLMFFGRLITEPKMAPAVRSLFSSRLDSFCNANTTSRGVLANICDSLHKYDLFHYLELWFRESIFPTYSNWKTIVKTKILKKEADDWFRFCSDQPSMQVAQTCLENISSYQFWSITDRYPDLVSRLYVQMRLMQNFGLNGGVPWLTNTDSELCLFCKNSVEDVVFLEFPFFSL